MECTLVARTNGVTGTAIAFSNLAQLSLHTESFQRCYDEVSQAVEETGGVVNHETAEKLAYLEVRTLDKYILIFR